MSDAEYLDIFLKPILVSQHYRPKFGLSRSDGVMVDDFLALYGADPFYAWIGLDSPLIYAAHRAAGGMTSLYRQIGIGCENLFRRIIADAAGYADPAQANWSYETRTQSGQVKTLKLDARLEFTAAQNQTVAARAAHWARQYAAQLDAEPPSNGLVFEVQQGYKSKDSKRQNADIDNATVAWSKGYLPVFAIFSGQIDADIVLRYRNNRCGILVGSLDADPHLSLYAFMSQVLGYDLAAFFNRNKTTIRQELSRVIETLLSAA
jgi:hypothetical protein